jgi:hypothetical protein
MEYVPTLKIRDRLKAVREKKCEDVFDADIGLSLVHR